MRALAAPSAILRVTLNGDAARDALDPRMKQREAGK